LTLRNLTLRNLLFLAFAAAAAMALGLSLPLSSPASANDTKQILVLHSFGREFKPWSEYAKAIRLELERQSPWPLDIQEHALVTARSSDENPEAAFVDYLHALHAKRKPDLIVSIGAPAAAFVQRHRQHLFPDAPMVLTVVDQRRLQYAALGPKDVVVAVAIDYHAAVRNILRILPDTKNLAMVVGASPIEKFWKDEIARESEPFMDRINFIWYDTLSFEEILKHAASLPPNSAIFWELMIVDAAGVVHEEGKALTRLHAVANAPIFSYTDAFFGREIVGGPHVPVLEAGQQVGAVAVRLLNGEDPAAIKVPPVGMGVPKFDWRELQRWGISESLLPPGSEVYFRSPTAWEQYRYRFIVVAAAILIQALIILWLLYEHRRRHAAEVLARSSMAELQHVNRLATAGELSASIAHEVKQPLAAAAASAYAARNWLGTKLNVDEALTAINQVAVSIHRANDVISGISAMFRGEDKKKQPVDMNGLIQSVLKILQLNLRRHGIEVETRLGSGLPLVEGNEIQLQQVVLNLVANAIDAMHTADMRKLHVGSGPDGSGGVRVTIEDTGKGIDPDQLDLVFKPLFTTKPSGMGMGLSICRSIVEAHGGRIRARPGKPVGSVFEFELPGRDETPPSQPRA
jgi:signal transduction histidine kinase